LSFLSSSSSMAGDADAGEADRRREGRRTCLAGARRDADRRRGGSRARAQPARPLGRSSLAHGRATGAGEAAAPAWLELAEDADRRRGDHRAPHCLPARLAGARRLEHGRALLLSTGGRRPGSKDRRRGGCSRERRRRGGRSRGLQRGGGRSRARRRRGGRSSGGSGERVGKKEKKY
jgi:hypothetical protein